MKKEPRWQRRLEASMAGVNERSEQEGLTIFTTPKAFRGHIRIIQTNAIQSWLMLRPECEVILFGNEKGTAEIAAKFGIRHIPEVGCNEYGTPLISSMFEIAQDVASHQLMCYVNADIILMNDFLPAIRQIHLQSFLLIGQRWDIDLKAALDFSNQDWEEELRAHLTKEGTLHGTGGLDYFVFPCGMYRDIPPFAVGRPGWDNWMVYKARSMKVPVIDATQVITTVHQNHDYSHLRGGKMEYQEGAERMRNRELTGYEQVFAFCTPDATWILQRGYLKKALTPKHIYYRIKAIPVLFPRFKFIHTPIRISIKLMRGINSTFGITKNKGR